LRQGRRCEQRERRDSGEVRRMMADAAHFSGT
jgi:hypothetical protein